MSIKKIGLNRGKYGYRGAVTETSKQQMVERLNAGADEPTAEVFLEEIEEVGIETGDDGHPE